MEAFNGLLLAYEKPLWKFIRRLARRADDVEELVQESRVRAWRSFGSFNGDSSFGTWHLAIASHVVADYYRRQDTHAQVVSDLHGQESPSPGSGSLSDLCENHEQLWQCMGCVTRLLSLEQQVVMLLRQFKKVSGPNTAKMLRKSLATIKRRLHESRMTLRQASGGRCPLVAQMGLPKESCLSLAMTAEGVVDPLGRCRAGRPPRRRMGLRDQLVREVLSFNPREAERLIAKARNW